MQAKTTILMLIAALACGQSVTAGPMTTQEKLDTIILPKVQFEDASLAMVLKYLKQRSKELDPEGKGVNIILIGAPPSTNKPAEPANIPKEAAAGDAAEPPKTPSESSATGSSDIRVTLDFDNIPLGALIDYLCKGTGLKHRVDQHAVMIASASVAFDRMETRIFPVGPGLLDSKPTR